MNNNLIQDFLDNRLTAEERIKFEAQLANDPALAQEVAALNHFKSSIQKAAFTEVTPNLQPILSDIARPRPTSWLTKSAPIAVAGFAIFGIGMAVNRVVNDRTNPTLANAKTLPAEAKFRTKSPLVMHWDGTDPIQGAEKIRNHFSRKIPTIALSDLEGANFTAAECGSCWISFHYQYQNQNYAIYGRCEKGSIDSGLQHSSGNQTFYEFQDAVGWYDSGDMTYVCTGGNSSGRFKVAQFASKRTSDIH